MERDSCLWIRKSQYFQESVLSYLIDRLKVILIKIPGTYFCVYPQTTSKVCMQGQKILHFQHVTLGEGQSWTDTTVHHDLF